MNKKEIFLPWIKDLRKKIYWELSHNVRMAGFDIISFESFLKAILNTTPFFFFCKAESKNIFQLPVQLLITLSKSNFDLSKSVCNDLFGSVMPDQS